MICQVVDFSRLTKKASYTLQTSAIGRQLICSYPYIQHTTVSTPRGGHYFLHDHTLNLRFLKTLTHLEKNLHGKSSLNRIIIMFFLFFIAFAIYILFYMNFLTILLLCLCFPQYSLCCLKAHRVLQQRRERSTPKLMPLPCYRSISPLERSQTVFSLQVSALLLSLPGLSPYSSSPVPCIYQRDPHISTVSFPCVGQTPHSVLWVVLRGWEGVCMHAHTLSHFSSVVSNSL